MSLNNFLLFMMYSDTRTRPDYIHPLRWRGMQKHWNKYGGIYIEKGMIPEIG